MERRLVGSVIPKTMRQGCLAGTSLLNIHFTWICACACASLLCRDVEKPARSSHVDPMWTPHSKIVGEVGEVQSPARPQHKTYSSFSSSQHLLPCFYSFHDLNPLSLSSSRTTTPSSILSEAQDWTDLNPTQVKLWTYQPQSPSRTSTQRMH